MLETNCPHCESAFVKPIIINESNTKSFRFAKRIMFCPLCNKEILQVSKNLRVIEIVFIILTLIGVLTVGFENTVTITVLSSPVILFLILNNRTLVKGVKIYDPANNSYN